MSTRFLRTTLSPLPTSAKPASISYTSVEGDDASVVAAHDTRHTLAMNRSCFEQERRTTTSCLQRGIHVGQSELNTSEVLENKALPPLTPAASPPCRHPKKTQKKGLATSQSLPALSSSPGVQRFISHAEATDAPRRSHASSSAALRRRLLSDAADELRLQRSPLHARKGRVREIEADLLRRDRQQHATQHGALARERGDSQGALISTGDSGAYSTFLNESHKTALKQCFSTLEKTACEFDGVGKVDLDELGFALTALGFAQHEVSELCRRADVEEGWGTNAVADGSASIDVDEFIKLIGGSSKPAVVLQRLHSMGNAALARQRDQRHLTFEQRALRTTVDEMETHAYPFSVVANAHRISTLVASYAPEVRVARNVRGLLPRVKPAR